MKRVLFIGIVCLVFVNSCGSQAEAAEMPDQRATSVATETPIIEPVATSTEASNLRSIPPDELPETRKNHAGDHDSSLTAHQKHAPNGDRFTFGVYERPFNADAMDQYYPELDIVDTFVYLDQDWIFAVLEVNDFDPEGRLNGKYGVEFDLNRDGKGDVLVLVINPSSSEWTTEGVQVYHDRNGGVGGKKPMVSDDRPGDGYEHLVFDSGVGNDPDLAWVRVTTGSVFVEMAIKPSAINNAERYLMNMWAGRENLAPELFDFNDFLTHEQAGAANRDYEYFYPIKALSEIDNSCKMNVGFEPVGYEPGLCITLIPKESGDPGAPGVCQPPPQGCGRGLSWNSNICACLD